MLFMQPCDEFVNYGRTYNILEMSPLAGPNITRYHLTLIQKNVHVNTSGLNLAYSLAANGLFHSDIIGVLDES